MTSIGDINSTLQNGVTNLSTIAQTLSNAFPQISGSFTLSNATTTFVTQTAIVAAGFPVLVAANAAAALAEITNGLYVSAVTAGSGFAISTQTGVASGTEAFHYIVFNPL
jgi:hypothetical protein